jgi:twitching motility protein PilT
MFEITNLFNTLIKRNGSDLHLEEGQKPKIRVNGQLVEIDNQILTKHAMISMMSNLVTIEDWQKFESKGDFDFAYGYENIARLRVNYYYHLNGLGAVFRLVPSKTLSMDELGLPLCLRDFAHWRSGLVLVTGPTGSGKSTTLASAIDYINANYAYKIVTIEDPVEFFHVKKKSLISHREVGNDTATFSSGLRAAIKSDANIILVGEMRDMETMDLALTASEMGILVLSTLHTNSATKTVDRIIENFPSNRKNQVRTILANNLRAVISQQILPSTDMMRRYVAFEVLLRTKAFRNLLLSGETFRLNTEIQTNRSMGMMLMDESLIELVKAGKVSKDEAYLRAIDKINFEKNLA